MKEALLEHIYEYSKCNYLSDLRIPMILMQAMPYIMKINEDAFTLEEWKQFYAYVTGSNTEYSNIADIKKSLQECAKNK